MESAKWSRNLSANNQSEISRMRQITKQKMENKRNRQQPMVTSTRQQSARTIKSAAQRRKPTDLDDSAEDLVSPDDSLEEKLNKEKLINHFTDHFGTATANINKQENNEKLDEKNSKIKEEIMTNNSKRQHFKMVNVSQTHSAEEDNLDDSSDEDSPILSNSNNTSRNNNKNKNRSATTLKTIEKSKSTFNLSDNFNDKPVNLQANPIESNTINAASRNLNPLKSLLSNSELLEFVINPVARNKVYQCTIIRDKKGLDRSLYPTYYMHLQTINSKDDNQQLKVEDYKESSLTKRDENDGGDNDCKANGNAMIPNGKAHNEKNSQSNNESISNDPDSATYSNRRVFLLSGRRRKKSKTYLTSCNPFEITRQNSIAKLRSNVLGTQFNTQRILQTNQRLDYATIIYDTNVLGFKGPRKMTILLPKIESTNYFKQIGMNSDITLTDLNKSDPKSVLKLKNKTPVWNEETQSYVLNFKGRVTQASVKNFQLEICDLTEELENRSKEDYIEASLQLDEQSPSSSSNKLKNTFLSNDFISMQFGRISNKEFTCDVSWPLSLLQAFSIALSSFDSKLACE